MKYLLFLLLPLITVAQKFDEHFGTIHYLSQRTCRSNFNSVYFGEENADNVARSLFKLIPALNIENTKMKFDGEQSSVAGKHYWFYQKVKGLRVYQSQLKVSTNGKGTLLSLFDNTVHQPILIEQELKQSLVLTHLSQFLNQYTLSTVEEVWMPTEDGALKNVFEIKMEGASGKFIELLVDNEGVLFERDLAMYFAAPDSVAKGYVFLPDPLTSAGKPYGGIYVDNSDSDAQWLTDERKQVNITTDFSGGIFYLRNSFVRVSDFDLPTTTVSTKNIPEFYFTRSQTGFEEVNLLYHISEMGKYVQQLGFNCANTLVEADAHAANGADNSYFAFNYTPTRLYFGDGGIDDAEDADVCIHEYSHFLSYSASPNTNVGNERQALDEAFGDYNAASYSRAINSYNWIKVYNWDGNVQGWNGRVVNSSKVYPTNISNNIYRDGEIWSSMLMQLWSDLGKTVTDKLVIQTHYSYAQNIKFIDAANLLLQADQQLFGGANYCAIAQRLFERGLLPQGKNLCPSSIDETTKEMRVSLVTTADGFAVASAETLWNATVEVFDISGKLILNQKMESGYTNIDMQAQAKGVYLVKVATPQQQKVLRYFRLNQ